MRSKHSGLYWIGGYETSIGDDGTGTLTSASFRATQPWASFLVGGGDWQETRVEIVTKDDGKVIHTARGVQLENMTRSAVDLRPVQGREIFVRLVDQRKGHWGHVNFDDFVFHAEKPNTKPSAAALMADVTEFAGLPADKAAQVATVPEGYELKVFAAEPDIINPVSFAIDDRARLWVVEGHTYPNRAKDGEGKDRVLVFEDTDGDGKHDKRTVFMEGLNLVSGIEVGHGGVYLGAAPYLHFVPVKDWNDPKPAGAPEVLLDGWGFQDTHETLNSFRWGPDGWLYGCHGVFTHSEVGAPGTPKEQRVKINAGIWRFHPVSKKFEVYANGTSNPWGIDWNADGDLFAEACVIPHLFHIIDGARYHRQAGAHFNSHTYEDIKTIADHRHYLGANAHAGNNKSDAAGGGHAHAGLAILSHPSWPEKVRGGVLMGNIHGSRINMDILERKGSGYVAKHGPDFINFRDKASQIVDLREGPDGTLFMIDWYDINQCHNVNRGKHDYTTGRVYRLAKKGTRLPTVNVATQSNENLARLFQHEDPWIWKHACRLLLERRPDKAEAERLFNVVHADGAASKEKARYGHRLTSLAIVLLREQTPAKTVEFISDWVSVIEPTEFARLIRAAAETAGSGEALPKVLLTQAQSHASPVVRLAIASACQRLTIEQRKPIVMALLAHKEDKDDHNLALMYWYAAEPIAGADLAAAAELLAVCKIPKVEEFLARRMAEK
jgi:putative membrane-bound dehydrogenase-like protein